MPVSTITALPPAPSRLGDAANFSGEALDFLEAQPAFQTECNAVASYLNAATWGVNNWGGLEAISGVSPVSISSMPLSPPTSGIGFELIEDWDAVLATLEAFVADANAVAAYIDGFHDAAAPPVSEPERPTVSTVSESPVRADTVSAFNSKGQSFYASARAFGLTVQELADYVTDYLSGTEDWGLITTTTSSTDDWGSV